MFASRLSLCAVLASLFVLATLEARVITVQQFIAENKAQTFEQALTACGKPVVLKFYASWCGPCRMSAPHFERASETLGDRVIFVEANLDAHRDLANRYSVRSIPTILLFNNGALAYRHTGSFNHQQITGYVSTYLLK